MTATAVWLDGGLVDPAAAVVSAFDHGVTVGDGVFETLRVYGGVPFALRRHLDRLGRSAVQRGVDPGWYLAWTRGRVRFRNAPLGEVAAELGRWFNVSVVVARPADARRRVTVDMPTRPLAEVLDAVTVPLKLRHAQDGERVVIRPPPAR